MDKDYNGGEIITITSEDGTVFELEHIITFEYRDSLYVACFPISMGGVPVPEDSDDYGTVILRIESENGEEFFASPDTDEELQGAYDAFMEALYAEDEDE